MVNVQAVIDRINQEFTDAQPAAGSFDARRLWPRGSSRPRCRVRPMASSLRSRRDRAMHVEKLNNSAAAEDIGFLDGTHDATSASFTRKTDQACGGQHLYRR